MIPIILGAVALASAAAGVVKGFEGIFNMNEAEEIGKNAQERYESAVEKLKVDWPVTNKLAEEYGQLQIDVKVRTIGRFVAFIERIGQHASQNDKRFLEGLDVSVQQLKEYKAVVIEAEQAFKGAFSAAATGSAAGYSAVGLVGLFGTASTGAAISGLSGAAAWNATLAWLGGGALAAGGGGMALGAIVLGGIAVGPALAIGGFMLAGEGEKALTKAKVYESKANKAVAEIKRAGEFLGQVRRRITELTDLVGDLNTRAVLALNELESYSLFDSSKDASKFQQVALLIKALVEILKTPVLNSEGNLNLGAVTILEKYRSLQGK